MKSARSHMQMQACSWCLPSIAAANLKCTVCYWAIFLYGHKSLICIDRSQHYCLLIHSVQEEAYLSLQAMQLRALRAHAFLIDQGRQWNTPPPDFAFARLPVRLLQWDLASWKKETPNFHMPQGFRKWSFLCIKNWYLLIISVATNSPFTITSIRQS